MVSLDEVGYPDYMDYEGDGGVAYIWMLFTLKNKKTKKIIKLPVHSQMWFNDEGKIVREDVYYFEGFLIIEVFSKLSKSNNLYITFYQP